MLISWKLCGLWQTMHLPPGGPLPPLSSPLPFSPSTFESDSSLPLELLSSANAAAAVQSENPRATVKRGTSAPIRPLAEGPALVEIPHNFFIKSFLLASNQYPIGCSLRSIEIPSCAGACKD